MLLSDYGLNASAASRRVLAVAVALSSALAKAA
jgi:hypothetical protein